MAWSQNRSRSLVSVSLSGSGSDCSGGTSHSPSCRLTGSKLLTPTPINRTRGYGKCQAPFIAVDVLDQQVADFLSTMVIPNGLKDRVERAVRSKIEHEAAFKRI